MREVCKNSKTMHMKAHLFLTILLSYALFACSPAQNETAENPEAEAIKGAAPEEERVPPPEDAAPCRYLICACPRRQEAD